jgi:chlorobactene glucosyltransferase
MDLFLLTLPWLLVATYTALMVRVPRRLPPASSWADGSAPPVSIIVPARNEEGNIGALLKSLSETQYPDFEIIIVDDESQDGTGEEVRQSAKGEARALRLIHGQPPPSGWFGKPWACHQGAVEATGDILLFTDADTVHHPELLSQTVQGLLSEEADVLTVLGRQIMGSFWERLLQPQFFALLSFRFPRAGSPKKPERWRDAIANGQYLLFHREVYDALGGHGAVKGEVVEDMRLAQLLVQGGQRLVVMEGPGLRTRMYDSLGGLVEGWSKNVTTGALQAVPKWLLHLILPLSFLVGFTLWLFPTLVLSWALVTHTGGLPLAFGAIITGFGVLFWSFFTGFMGANPLYGFLFPLGSLASAYIFLLSWVRGSRIRWKGREYEMSPDARKGGRVE